MSARDRTTIRDKDQFGPREKGGKWTRLRTFCSSIDPETFYIPQNARSNIAYDGTFRLDMQKRFTVEGREFYNLQVQEGGESIFAVYIEVSGYGPGKISNRVVVDRIKQAAIHKTEDTTVYLDDSGNVKFQLVRP